MEHLYEYPNVRWLPAGAKSATDAATDRPAAGTRPLTQKELVEASLLARPYEPRNTAGSNRNER